MTNYVRSHSWIFSISFAFILGTILSALIIPSPSPIAASRPLILPYKDQQEVVAHIYYQSEADLNQLAVSVDAFEEVNRKEGYLTALLHPGELESLRARGYRVEVNNRLSQSLNTNRPMSNPEGNGIPGFACYRTVEETYNALFQIANDYPNLAKIVDIGDSWEKVTNGSGYEIYNLVITNQALPGPKPKLFLIAAMHAREYTTAELATRFAEHLVKNYNIDPDITWMLDYFEVHIAPQTNPDGRKIAETGILWRKNTDNNNGCNLTNAWGTDLNRNSSFLWNGPNGGSSGDPCSETYRGPAPLSEPEVQSIQNYAASIFLDQRADDLDTPVDPNASGVFITLHSYSELVLFPWGWTNEPSPNYTQLETLGRKFGYYNGYSVCYDCLYIADGVTDDWMYGELGIASYTFELGTWFFESCSDFENLIYPENLPALVYALKATRRPYQNPAGPDSIQVTLDTDSVTPGTPVVLTAIADDTRYDSNGYGAEPSQNIKTTRYSIDTPSWITATKMYSMTPFDGDFDSSVESIQATIDTSTFSEGRHTIFVESQDTNGNWGVPSAVFLEIQPGFDVQINSKTEKIYAQPGDTVLYNMTITNTGNLPDTYNITSTSTWTHSLSTNSVEQLLPGETFEIIATVQVPQSAQPGDWADTVVRAISYGNREQIANISLQTMIPYYNLEASIDTLEQSLNPGSSITYTVYLTNTGNISDTYGVFVNNSLLTTSYKDTISSLEAGKSTLIPVVVYPPEDPNSDSFTDNAIVTVYSQTNRKVAFTTILTTTYNPIRMYIPLLLR